MTNETIMTNKQKRRIATLGLGALTAACLTVPVGAAYGAEPTSVWSRTRCCGCCRRRGRTTPSS